MAKADRDTGAGDRVTEGHKSLGKKLDGGEIGFDVLASFYPGHRCHTHSEVGGSRCMFRDFSQLPYGSVDHLMCSLFVILS